MHLMTWFQLAKYNNFIDIDSHLTFESALARIQRGTGVRATPENHKAIGSLSNAGPDTMEIIKLPNQH